MEIFTKVEQGNHRQIKFLSLPYEFRVTHRALIANVTIDFTMS